MSLEYQKFYRFILPGAILVASNCFILLDIFNCKINEISDVNSFIYWIYIVIWHFLFEKDKMQKDEVSWLDEKIVLNKETVFHFSNLIWHYIDIKSDYEGFAGWLRSNFLLIHSLGCSLIALIIGLALNLSIKRILFFKETISLMWLFWLVLGIFIFMYRSELKKRYMKRLEIFIKQNSSNILEIQRDINRGN